MACPPHPYGVQPFGQLYMGGPPDARGPGLGRLAALSDELLLGVLGLLPAGDLQRLGLASRALCAFAHYDELWKALVLEGLEGGIQGWHGSWRETYLGHMAPRQYKVGSHRPLAVPGLYSDLLYQPWRCATMGMLPEWLEVENVDRRSGLSAAEFCAAYEVPNKPVIITDVVRNWPAFTKWRDRAYLLQAFAGREVIVGNAPMRLAPYLAYADSNKDEMPLYMFDKAFALAAPQLADDYSVPEYFADDLFAVLGEDRRPDYRWLIVGPRGSGSSFHVDPNATSAWNAVVTGAKKWILYPPGCTPPGVHISDDGADVAAPVSLTEWFLNFYNAARHGEESDSEEGVGGGKRPVVTGAGPRARARPRHVRPLECVVSAGELLFVPRGWFHMVVNLDESIAVTQNFVSPTGVGAVLSFLRTGAGIPGLVSGCAHRETLHLDFLSALREHRPEVVAAVEAREAAQRQKAQRDSRLGAIFRDAAAARDPRDDQGKEPAANGFPAVAGSGEKPGAANSTPAAFTFGFAL